MQNPSLPAEVRDLFNRAYQAGTKLGRKFEAQDMTIDLRQAARAYVATYEGDFEYLVDLRDRVQHGAVLLSDNQSKGVLNCLMAEARRIQSQKGRATTAATAAPREPRPLAKLPDGRYRITFPSGESRAYRFELADWAEDKPKGTRAMSLRTGGSGSEREWSFLGFVDPQGYVTFSRKAEPYKPLAQAAISTLEAGVREDNWLVFGLSYAQEGSNCFRCGRDLDTPESLLVGYGPTCADKLGLPWGAKAQPMSVVLGQAAAQHDAVTAEAVFDADGKIVNHDRYNQIFPDDAPAF